MMQSEQVNELFEAMSKAQAEMSGVKKETENSFFKSKYADLHSILEAVRDILAKHDLCVIQTITAESVRTTLGHKSGQWIAGECPIINTKGDAQGMGSAITYSRRYSLAAICGVAQTDDDGNAAVTAPAPPPKVPKDVVGRVIERSLACLETGDEYGLREIWAEFNTDEKAYLWRNFNSAQRGTMKQFLSGESNG